jgi:hypothetical protein
MYGLDSTDSAQRAVNSFREYGSDSSTFVFCAFDVQRIESLSIFTFSDRNETWFHCYQPRDTELKDTLRVPVEGSPVRSLYKQYFVIYNYLGLLKIACHEWMEDLIALYLRTHFTYKCNKAPHKLNIIPFLCLVTKAAKC